MEEQFEDYRRSPAIMATDAPTLLTPQTTTTCISE